MHIVFVCITDCKFVTLAKPSARFPRYEGRSAGWMEKKQTKL